MIIEKKNVKKLIKILSFLSILILLIFIIRYKYKVPMLFGFPPRNAYPEWSITKIDNLPIKLGQVIEFQIDSTYFKTLILEFKKDKEGNWIGLCFLENNKIFGRKISTGMRMKPCLDLIDFSYLNLKGVKDYKILDSFELKNKRIGIGSVRPVNDLNELYSDYVYGLNRRKLKRIPCKKGIYEDDAVKECYFDIEKIVIPKPQQ